MRKYGNNHKTPIGASGFAFKGFCAIGRFGLLLAIRDERVADLSRNLRRIGSNPSISVKSPTHQPSLAKIAEIHDV